MCWGRESDEIEIKRLRQIRTETVREMEPPRMRVIGAERVWQKRSSENERVQSRERGRMASRE